MLTTSFFFLPDWPAEEAEQPSGSAANGHNVHLWEESWDDDDTAEDFSKQLKCVIALSAWPLWLGCGHG